MRPFIDVTLAAVRRPDLLETTLKSFSTLIFSTFNVSKVFVNLDPVAGELRERDECIRLLDDYFGDYSLREPDVASFGDAVKYLWSCPSSDVFLHMEDDWLATSAIDIDQAIQRLKRRVVQLRFAHKMCTRRRFPRANYSLLVSRAHVPNVLRPRFAAGPSFMTASFGRSCSSLMNPSLDPEKQMYSGTNPTLSKFTRRFLSVNLYGPNRSYIVQDLGREWRERRGIHKSVERGTMSWITDIQSQ